VLGKKRVKPTVNGIRRLAPRPEKKRLQPLAAYVQTAKWTYSGMGRLVKIK